MPVSKYRQESQIGASLVFKSHDAIRLPDDDAESLVGTMLLLLDGGPSKKVAPTRWRVNTSISTLHIGGATLSSTSLVDMDGGHSNVSAAAWLTWVVSKQAKSRTIFKKK
jgi:hypothetical protein